MRIVEIGDEELLRPHGLDQAGQLSGAHFSPQSLFGGAKTTFRDVVRPLDHKRVRAAWPRDDVPYQFVVVLFQVSQNRP